MAKMPAWERDWQRKWRRNFAAENGYSISAHYATGGLRKQVLERDGFRCVKCGMTDDEHKKRWGRPITIDHKDKNRKNNTLSNLQTLCLKCHGSKDISKKLTIQRVPKYKSMVLWLRENGFSYRQIANVLGFSVASIWKWVKRWNNERSVS